MPRKTRAAREDTIRDLQASMRPRPDAAENPPASHALWLSLPLQ